MKITVENYQFWIFAVGGSLLALAYGRLIPKATPTVAPYSLALAIDPDYALGHYNVGVSAHEAGQLEAAHLHYRAALAADPSDHTPCFNDAKVTFELRKLDDALAAAQCAILYNTKDAAAVDLLGQVLVARGEHAKAVEVLERALRMRPDNVPTRIDLGAAYAGQERYEEAEQALRVAVVSRPDLAEAWFNLGLVVWKRGNVDEAYVAFERAAAADPRMVKAMRNLVFLDVEQGRRAPAMAWLDRILAIEPQDPRALNLRAELLRGQ